MYRLGGLYATGRGVGRDPAQARLWYQKAADLGHDDARRALAKLH
jgi:TPR repeat protein